MNLSFAFQPLSSAKVNTESGSRPVGPSQPLALVLNRLEYSLTFAYRVKSKLLIGPIFGGAYKLNVVCPETLPPRFIKRPNRRMAQSNTRADYCQADTTEYLSIDGWNS